VRLMYHFVEHTRACEICGKPYKVGGGRGLWNKLTCGPACAREKFRRKCVAWRRARREQRLILKLRVVRVCAVCGRPFTLKRSSAWNRMLCSRACQEERLRQQYRAWRRAHPDYSRERIRRRKEAAKGKASRQSSDDLAPGFCLGCGGKIRRAPYGEKRSANIKDMAHWHLTCYRRFHYRWTRGLFKGQGVERACVICGRKFASRRFGPVIQKVCSEECRKEQSLRLVKAWRERNPEQVELWIEAKRDRLHALRQGMRQR